MKKQLKDFLSYKSYMWIMSELTEALINQISSFRCDSYKCAALIVV